MKQSIKININIKFFIYLFINSQSSFFSNIKKANPVHKIAFGISVILPLVINGLSYMHYRNKHDIEKLEKKSICVYYRQSFHMFMNIPYLNLFVEINCLKNILFKKRCPLDLRYKKSEDFEDTILKTENYNLAFLLTTVDCIGSLFSIVSLLYFGLKK